MTALAGLISQKMQSQQDVARRLALALVGTSARGSDDRNAFVQGPCAFASWTRRTVDLTPDGAQPFTVASFTVAIDGYVGNAAILRRELEEMHKCTFRGHGDAELIATGASTWGLNRLLQRLEGAFTFALWDADNAALHLVRDRMGIRPLYVAEVDGTIAFSSDLQSFRALPGFGVQINPDAAAAYLAFGHLSAPLSLFKGVTSLPPGHRLMIGASDETLPMPEAWWSPATTIEESNLRGIPDSSRLDRLIAALSGEAVRLDTPFALLDDFSRPTFQLRSNLDRVSDKPYKAFPLSLPDGAALQTAYDALSLMGEPVADPMASSWYIACKNAAKESPVLLAANGIDSPAAETPGDRKWRKTLSGLPAFLKSLLPARYAHYAADPERAYLAALRLWDIGAPEPAVIEPRIDASLAARIAFFECADHMRNAVLPGLDRIAHAAGIELRLPMADPRMLDFGLPAPTGAGNPDIATWLRGPLRPRVESHLNAANFARIGIDDPKQYLDAWKAFIGGDNTKTKGLWTLATLLAWAARQ